MTLFFCPFYLSCVSKQTAFSIIHSSMLFLAGAFFFIFWLWFLSVLPFYLFAASLFSLFFWWGMLCHSCLYLFPVLFSPVRHQRRGPMLHSVRPILWCLELCAFLSLCVSFLWFCRVFLYSPDFARQIRYVHGLAFFVFVSTVCVFMLWGIRLVRKNTPRSGSSFATSPKRVCSTWRARGDVVLHKPLSL